MKKLKLNLEETLCIEQIIADKLSMYSVIPTKEKKMLMNLYDKLIDIESEITREKS